MAEPMTTNAFNNDLAKLLRGLKKSTGACMVRQQYRGTGSMKAYRQILVRWEATAARGDRTVCVWLDGYADVENSVVYFDAAFNCNGEAQPSGLPKCRDGIPTKGRTPQEVYADVENYLLAWLSS